MRYVNPHHPAGELAPQETGLGFGGGGFVPFRAVRGHDGPRGRVIPELTPDEADPLFAQHNAGFRIALGALLKAGLNRRDA